jgi:hypothetical protein
MTRKCLLLDSPFHLRLRSFNDASTTTTTLAHAISNKSHDFSECAHDARLLQSRRMKPANISLHGLDAVLSRVRSVLEELRTGSQTPVGTACEYKPAIHSVVFLPALLIHEVMMWSSSFKIRSGEDREVRFKGHRGLRRSPSRVGSVHRRLSYGDCTLPGSDSKG